VVIPGDLECQFIFGFLLGYQCPLFLLNGLKPLLLQLSLDRQGLTTQLKPAIGVVVVVVVLVVLLVVVVVAM